MRGLPSILSLFHNEFNKFNNTGARKLDSIYHMTSKLIKISFLCENLKKTFWVSLRKVTKSVYRFYSIRLQRLIHATGRS